MRVIKDNSNKEIRVKCKNCKSILKVKRIEIKKGFASSQYIECPVCKEETFIKY